MCLHVLIKVLLHVEVFSAPLAHELLMSYVDAHVGTQLVFVLEALAAVLQQNKRCPELLKNALEEPFSNHFEKEAET